MADGVIERIRATASDTSARLHAVLVCDLALSDAQLARLDDARVAELNQRHERLARDCLQRHGGREIDKTDGFLLLFERPIQAVAFALDYQHALRELSAALGEPVTGRVGIHVGEVLLWHNSDADVADGAKPVEVEGLAKAVAARLMALARPGQILLSDIAHGLAYRARGELGPLAGHVRWLHHDRYRLKGVDAPMPVHEVGERGHAPLRPPTSGAKARRIVPWWRRRWLRVAAAVLLFGTPLAWLLQPAPAIAFGERDWVVLASLRNLTSYDGFDVALDTALRVGLEQSHYVNVVSVLSQRQTLRTMERDPDQPIDRDIGSEIATRQGARALIVPTVAEVGGRVRLTAELVDPRSGITVYTESADGANEAEVLNVADRLLGKLRDRLGESLASVERNSVPMAQATTGNLEALRAYGLALRAWSASQPDAEALARRAVTLDPGFALAHVLLASIAYAESRYPDAERELRTATRQRDRLTEREALFLDAAAALLDSAGATLDAWRVLAKLYPDEYRAYHNWAYFNFVFTHDYAAALDFLAPALGSRNARAAESRYLSAILMLALNRPEAAEQTMRTALAERPDAGQLHLLTILAAQRKWPQIDQLDPDFRSRPIAQRDLETLCSALAMQVERDGIDAAATSAERWRAALRDAGHDPDAERMDAVVLLLQSAAGHAPSATRLAAFVAEREAAVASAGPMDIAQLRAEQLLALALDAGAGGTLAADRLDVLAAAVQQIGQPWLTGLVTAVRAEQLLAAGDPQAAGRLLDDALDGREPCLLHALRQRAASAAGDTQRAALEHDWLQRNRPRAWAEADADFVLQPLNVWHAR